MTVPSALAGSGAASRLFSEVMPWLLLLMGLVIVGGVIIMLARRLLNDTSSSTQPGFTLHELRTLHTKGELTDEEFDRAREAMIARLADSGPRETPNTKTADNDGSAD